MMKRRRSVLLLLTPSRLLKPLTTPRTMLMLTATAAAAAMAGCATASADAPVFAEGHHPLRLPPLPGSDDDAPLPLWLHLPRGYLAPGDGHRWPLVVFLHGSGERGDGSSEQLGRVTVNGLPKLAAHGADFGFILASPQLPDGRRWEAAQLHALLGALRRLLRIDADRVAATGLSLGGHGVWDWATAYPGDLAAIAPVCGFGDADDVCRAQRVPVRAYHGSADTVVPLAGQQACVDALRGCGGSVDFIVFDGVGHDAWTRAYADPALLPWLLAQRRQRGGA